MRKYCFALLSAAAVMVGCSKEDIPSESAGIPMTINVSIGDAATKTTYTPDGGALKVEWEAGDQISVVSIGSDNIAKTCDTFTASAGGSSAEFTGTYTGAADAKMIRVFYPALTETGSLNGTNGWVAKTVAGMYDQPFFAVSNENTFSKFSFTYSNQFADGDASHLKYYDSMSATLTSVDELETVTLAKNTSIIKLIINTSSIADGSSVKSVHFENLGAVSPFNYSDWHYSNDDFGNATHNSSKYLNINLGSYLGGYTFTGITKTSSDNELVVYLPNMGDITMKGGDQYSITVTTYLDGVEKRYKKTVTLPSNISIHRGSCFTISATVAE